MNPSLENSDTVFEAFSSDCESHKRGKGTGRYGKGEAIEDTEAESLENRYGRECNQQATREK